MYGCWDLLCLTEFEVQRTCADVVELVSWLYHLWMVTSSDGHLNVDSL